MYDATLMVPRVMNFDRRACDEEWQQVGRARLPVRTVPSTRHAVIRRTPRRISSRAERAYTDRATTCTSSRESASSAAGCGCLKPKVLDEIRNRIVDKPAEWKRARVNLSHPEDALKRPPRGFDPDHPMIEDIKQKSFTTGVKITNKQVLADDFMKTFIGACREIAPLMKFLATAADVSW